jgi:hypothetical protein
VSRAVPAKGTHSTALTVERQEQMIVRLAEWIQIRGLRSLAILFLEAHKPLAPVVSQALLFLQPLLGSLGPMSGWFNDDWILTEYALLLEDSASVDRVLALLEHRPSERG